MFFIGLKSKHLVRNTKERSILPFTPRRFRHSCYYMHITLRINKSLVMFYVPILFTRKTYNSQNWRTQQYESNVLYVCPKFSRTVTDSTYVYGNILVNPGIDLGTLCSIVHFFFLLFAINPIYVAQAWKNKQVV